MEVDLVMEASSMFMRKQSVKTMAEDHALSSRESPLEPLPDLILHSSPSVVRRHRSNTVNLPVVERYQNIGNRLRRFSDQFEEEREVSTSFGFREIIVLIAVTLWTGLVTGPRNRLLNNNKDEKSARSV